MKEGRCHCKVIFSIVIKDLFIVQVIVNIFVLIYIYIIVLKMMFYQYIQSNLFALLCKLI